MKLITITKKIIKRITKIKKETLITPVNINFSFTQSGNYTETRKERSVVFYRNNYYHLYYLSQALRKRGWDTLTVSLEPPESPSSLYYHGEDLNLFTPNKKLFLHQVTNFFKIAQDRYEVFHVSNDFGLSFFPHNYDEEDPWDLVQWKEQGKKIAYTISGCLSATTQSSVEKWSLQDKNRNISVCNTCIWKHQPHVCSDEKSDSFGRKVEKYVDVIFAEGLPALDYIALPKAMREPTTMCLDPIVWHPELEIPQKHKIGKTKKEILIYHGVGNYKLRTDAQGKNIKGTRAILAAIETLKTEGFPVRLIFSTSLPNREVRFIQAQADIIVDQLNYGRYGAIAREGMMLGKPVICYIHPFEYRKEDYLKSLEECPLVSAREETVYDVLKDLILHPDKREAIGARSRHYALKWHSPDACAERYEQIYDLLMANNPLIYPSQWSYFNPKMEKSL